MLVQIENIALETDFIYYIGPVIEINKHSSYLDLCFEIKFLNQNNVVINKPFHEFSCESGYPQNYYDYMNNLRDKLIEFKNNNKTVIAKL